MSSRLPKCQRLQAGRYIIKRGKEAVDLFYTQNGNWEARPREADLRRFFRTKREAVGWAHGWLAEWT